MIEVHKCTKELLKWSTTTLDDDIDDDGKLPIDLLKEASVLHS